MDYDLSNLPELQLFTFSDVKARECRNFIVTETFKCYTYTVFKHMTYRVTLSPLVFLLNRQRQVALLSFCSYYICQGERNLYDVNL